MKEDHPRSRGVYVALAGDSLGGGGSSPLARGLQPPRTPTAMAGGIIPARAGFTSTRTPESWTSSDHPRSRGVYQKGESFTCVRAGIIPARAGFTWRRKEHIGNMEDHPRSRGVY